MLLQRLEGEGSLHLLVTAVVSNVFAVKELPQNLDGFGQPRLAHPWRVEAMSDGLVLGEGVPGADSDFQPSTAKNVESRQLLGKKDGVAQVVVDNQWTDADSSGGERRSGERSEQARLGANVVTDLDDVKALLLGRLRRPD